MKSIWKFLLEPDGSVAMPVGAEILTVQAQREEAYIWAVVDPEAPTLTRRFKTFATGEPITGDPGRYVGTFQISGGALVFHVFEQDRTSHDRRASRKP